MRDLTIEIDGLLPEPVKFALREELEISSDIERDIRRLPALFGYFAILSEKAESRCRRAKLAFDMWRNDYEDELCTGTKFSRVKDMTRLVMKHPKYKAWVLKMDEYEENAKVLKAIARSFEHKKDLVQTMAANRRKELRGD